MVSAPPIASDITLTSPMSGHELAVLGNVRAPAVGACEGVPAAAFDAAVEPPADDEPLVADAAPRADAEAAPPPPAGRGRERRLHFFLSHHLRRHRCDDGRAQPIALTEIIHGRRLSVAHDLDAALVNVPLCERLDAFLGPHDDGRPRRLHDGAVLHFGDGDRGDRRACRNRGRAFHSRLQLAYGHRLPVDHEAKIFRDGHFSRAFRQPDNQLVALHREHFERLGFRGRRLLRQRHGGCQTDNCHGQGSSTHRTCHRTLSIF